MADLFNEVDEQLRSDQVRNLARRALPWVLGVGAAALIAAGGYWGWLEYRERAAGKASEQYAASLEALDAGRQPQAAGIWEQISKSGPPAYKSLALMQLGALKLGENRTAEAVKLFDDAAKAAPDEALADAARLKSAFALLDTAPYKEVEGRLTPLLQDGRPYRVQAREALAFAKLMAGNLAGARGDFAVIGQMLDAPEGARARAKAAMELIDSGSAAAVSNTVRAAAALPPAPPEAPVPGAPSAVEPQSQTPVPQ